MGADGEGRAARGAAGPADDAGREQVEMLLGKVRDLRLALSADLSTVAGALEEKRPDVASDILAADCASLASLSDESSRITQAVTAQPRSAPRPRRRRALLALPAVPLLGAAAMSTAVALGAIGATHQAAAPKAVAQHAGAQRPAARAEATPGTTLRRLEDAVRHHSRAATVVAVADHLHAQLTAIIAGAHGDPSRLARVQQILNAEVRVLGGRHAPGVDLALAASRRVARLLDTTPVKSTGLLPQLPAPPGAADASTPPVSPTSHPTHHRNHPKVSAPKPTSGATHGQRHHRHHHRAVSPSDPPTAPPLLGNSGLLDQF